MTIRRPIISIWPGCVPARVFPSEKPGLPLLLQVFWLN
jgi:hypothetical protein